MFVSSLYANYVMRFIPAYSDTLGLIIEYFELPNFVRRVSWILDLCWGPSFFETPTCLDSILHLCKTKLVTRTFGAFPCGFSAPLQYSCERQVLLSTGNVVAVSLSFLQFLWPLLCFVVLVTSNKGHCSKP